MSFFVSKSLEGHVDENCLIKHKEKNDKKEFVLVTDKLTCHVLEINFKESNQAIIKCKGNIHVIDTMFNNCLNGQLIFKNSSIPVFDLKIHEILKKESDSYIINIFARYNEVTSNDKH